jgi:hypothetical protein
VAATEMEPSAKIAAHFNRPRIPSSQHSAPSFEWGANPQKSILTFLNNCLKGIVGALKTQNLMGPIR